MTDTAVVCLNKCFKHSTTFNETLHSEIVDHFGLKKLSNHNLCRNDEFAKVDGDVQEFVNTLVGVL